MQPTGGLQLAAPAVRLCFLKELVEEPLLLPPMPERIIIDTDMSIDVDDVGALCLAHALQDRNKAEILAVTHNTGLEQGVGAVSVINHYFGRDDIPIGAYRGPVG
ncbi:hypothetical protein EMIHUDRAFT_229346 [Emiliania huxleyi CCMP1516]|uniref:Inosine/uridine-preferring nucleoside hydrolase domain-containing protein n=2 Tax=Emiliania huxleyi TaxID=2903 RepID=A0A0D3JB50_EMIH1|nr:hypothetical protein EMIHUDRAFT_241868 [Emiliania huxleyi CCMP1516]XP_005786061.1 hypothetical protein EMIHUDRAFT_229346 [Emiliania huxleyi CCMP1516]EOD20735.1 hypothetical protein EMIHUDRAFT_241868 [Emiliania huxleyi CCMP1516]EOD33632.1 hypothetical protein EMIHUDRAFT_229346 [Emiliania huxleyi CCMP1516]|eukprot:XP_005773164.1 hypothetical protein EMIHUDRAFT_241868 [Emiliania huxleyi CCMP1516]